MGSRTSQEFLNLMPNVQSVDGRIEKFELHQIKHFLFAKDHVKGQKDKLQTGERYLQTRCSTKY